MIFNYFPSVTQHEHFQIAFQEVTSGVNKLKLLTFKRSAKSFPLVKLCSFSQIPRWGLFGWNGDRRLLNSSNLLRACFASCNGKLRLITASYISVHELYLTLLSYGLFKTETNFIIEVKHDVMFAGEKTV